MIGKRLPVQEVKIDKSFVLSLCTDSDDQAIARSSGLAVLGVRDVVCPDVVG